MRFSYPIDYTKTDEANYRVGYTDGFKVIEYWEEFYGSVGLTLDLYKPRTPVNSLLIFSALWVVLIAFVVWTRRRRIEE